MPPELLTMTRVLALPLKKLAPVAAPARSVPPFQMILFVSPAAMLPAARDMPFAVRVPPPRVIVFVFPETVRVEEPLVTNPPTDPRVIVPKGAEPPVTLIELLLLTEYLPKLVVPVLVKAPPEMTSESTELMALLLPS